MIFKKRRPKIGLALGSGGAKGYAHIGVIKALEKNGIPIDYIAGSSVGSLIGGLYAATKDIELIENLAFSTPRSAIRSFLFDPCLQNGFCKGTKFHTFIQSHVGNTSFNDLQIPFVATSTDLHSGETILLKEGNVSEAIQTSCAVPMVFKPLQKDNYLLTDGGISMPVPVQAVKEMGADIVIAVNLCNEYYDENFVSSIGLTTIFLNTYGIMAHHLANEHIKQADISISPPLKHIGWKFIVSDENKRNAIELGEAFMQKEIPAIKTLIKKKTRTTIINPFLLAKRLSESVKKKSQSLTQKVSVIPSYNIETVKYFVRK